MLFVHLGFSDPRTAAKGNRPKPRQMIRLKFYFGGRLRIFPPLFFILPLILFLAAHFNVIPMTDALRVLTYTSNICLEQAGICSYW